MNSLDNEVGGLRNYVLEQVSNNDYMYQWQKYKGYKALGKATQGLDAVAEKLKTAAKGAEGVSKTMRLNETRLTRSIYRRTYPDLSLLYLYRSPSRRYNNPPSRLLG